VGAEARLPLSARALYASSSLGSEAVAQSRGLWLLFLYTDELGLDTALVGALLFAGRFLEAFDDPLVAYLSDRTRSRWGRRIPFVVAATPFWALFAVLLFSPPAGSGTAATAAYLFVVLELSFIFSTLAGGPYEALLPEVARTSADRISIVGLRVYFGAAGAAVGVAASGLIIDSVGFQGMAVTMAVLLLVTRYAGLAGVWRHASRTQPPAALPFRVAVTATLSNPSFLAFLPTFVLFQTALQMVLGVLPFQVEAVLGEQRRDRWVSILTAVALGTAVALVPLFARLARRTSKRHAYAAAMLAAALLFPLLALAGFLPSVPAEPQLVVLLAVAGAPLVGVYLFPAALTADIADDDALRTGMRREAMYFGTQNFVEKTTTSLAPLLLGGLLALGRTADDPLGIRLVGPVAGLLVLAGWVVFRGYRLPDEVR
jgi:GPH family glycoside/pentoside/hexuronide:cation symporter